MPLLLGLEYVITAGDEEQVCKKVRPIQSVFGDVSVDKNRKLTQIFVYFLCL